MCKRIKVLGALTWSSDVEDRFFKTGATELPQVPLRQSALTEEKATLIGLLKELDEQHPIEAFMARTARSYLKAADMLESVGTPRFTELSIQIYGQPGDRLHQDAPTNLELATHALEKLSTFPLQYPQPHIPSDQAAQILRDRIGARFAAPPLPVVVDPSLMSLAAAGANRVRIRGGSRFSATQLDQLFEHEVMIHSATKRNGKNQPILKSMGLSSPRTAATQEGLATLAELITGVMDMQRLGRISLRILATAAALEGADFLDIYAMHRDRGHDEKESFRSTARIFRGGDVRGGIAFTKDVVYLRGLVDVHAFLRVAIQNDSPHLIAMMFAGRLTLQDVLSLQGQLAEGWIQQPSIMPQWASNLPCLVASLTWMMFDDLLHLEQLTLKDWNE